MANATPLAGDNGGGVRHPGPRAVLLVFAGVALMVGVLLHIGAVMGTDLSNDPWSYDAPRWQQPYIRWDSEWYLSIADDGYFVDDDLPSSAAFFPGFPLAMRWLGQVPGDTVTAGIVVSLVSGAAALLAMRGWCAAIGHPAAAWHATLVLALTPFSMYLYGPLYADGLFIASTIGAFWALERDRSLLMIAGGAVAAATRVIGASVPLLLVLRLVERRQRGERDAPNPGLPLLSFVTVAAHLAILADRFGDPLAFASAAGAHGWDEGISVSSILKLEFFDILSGAQPADAVHQVTQVLGLILTLGVLALLPRVWRSISPCYALVTATMIGIPLLSNNDFLGFGRYVLAAFPAALALAHLIEERHVRAPRLAVLSTTLLSLLTVLLGMDYLIA